MAIIKNPQPGYYAFVDPCPTEKLARKAWILNAPRSLRRAGYSKKYATRIIHEVGDSSLSSRRVRQSVAQVYRHSMVSDDSDCYTEELSPDACNIITSIPVRGDESSLKASVANRVSSSDLVVDGVSQEVSPSNPSYQRVTITRGGQFLSAKLVAKLQTEAEELFFPSYVSGPTCTEHLNLLCFPELQANQRLLSQDIKNRLRTFFSGDVSRLYLTQGLKTGTLSQFVLLSTFLLQDTRYSNAAFLSCLCRDGIYEGGPYCTRKLSPKAARAEASKLLREKQRKISRLHKTHQVHELIFHYPIHLVVYGKDLTEYKDAVKRYFVKVDKILKRWSERSACGGYLSSLEYSFDSIADGTIKPHLHVLFWFNKDQYTSTLQDWVAKARAELKTFVVEELMPVLISGLGDDFRESTRSDLEAMLVEELDASFAAAAQEENGFEANIVTMNEPRLNSVKDVCKYITYMYKTASLADRYRIEFPETGTNAERLAFNLKAKDIFNALYQLQTSTGTDALDKVPRAIHCVGLNQPRNKSSRKGTSPRRSDPKRSRPTVSAGNCSSGANRAPRGS